jgi:hypothetical protein
MDVPVKDIEKRKKLINATKASWSLTHTCRKKGERRLLSPSGPRPKPRHKTTTKRIKNKGVDSGNVGKEKVAMLGNRLDVGNEKDSGETKITMGFLAGRSMIGWYFPLQWKTRQIGKISSFMSCYLICQTSVSRFGLLWEQWYGDPKAWLV